MPCQNENCKSDRIASVSGKTSDLCFYTFKGAEKDGYVPYDVGIDGGDYIAFSYCLECGQMQGEFPVEDPQFYGSVERGLELVRNGDWNEYDFLDAYPDHEGLLDELVEEMEQNNET